MSGVTSIGFQTLPVISRTTLNLLGSFQDTVADFLTSPSKLAELNWSGMIPVLPGSTCRSQVPAVVQPQPGRTPLISSKTLPVLVNTKSCLTNSPGLTLPKSKIRVANSILGLEVSGVPAADVVPDDGAGASAGARHETTAPNVPATINDLKRWRFIDVLLSQMSPLLARK